MQEQKMVNNFTYNFGNFGDIIDNYDRDKSNFIVKKIPSNNIHYTKYLIKYKKDSLDNDNIEMLSLYRSIIVFKDNTTNKFSLKSFSAPKSLNYNSFIEKNNFDSCFITEIVDGTMVNMFYDVYSEEWVVCTKSNYGANCKFNLDIDLTFKEMFEECFKNDNLNYDMFNKKYSYSFILQHPKNRIVTPVRNPTLYLIGVYKCEDNKALLLLDTEEYNIMKTPENFNYDEFIELFCTDIDDEWLQLTYVCSEKILRYDIPGYNIYDMNGVRTKIRNLSYEYIKRMKGNGQKRLFTYLKLRNNGNLNEFIKYYPEYIDEFDKYKEKLYEWTDKLYNNYVECFILKNKSLKNCDYELKPILYDIQKIYLSELFPNNRKVNFKFVVEYIKKMPVQKIMFSMNYGMRKKEVFKTD